MKKLLGMVAFVTIGLFASLPDAPAQSATQVVELSTVTTSSVADEAVVPEAAAACPVFAPKCCVRLANRCVNCVGWDQECP